MNKMRLIITFVCTLLIGLSVSHAQVLRDADNAFKHCQYEKALETYKKGIKSIRKNQIEVRRVTFQIAECYRIMGDLKHAEQQYIRLEKKNYQKDNPIILFHLGSIYNLRGEYDKAVKYYQIYQKRNPDDKRVEFRIEGCQKTKMWIENPTRYEVENLKKFNTRENEWAPRWGNLEKYNQIIFSSNRDGSVGKGTDQWTGTAFADLYKSDKPKSKNTDWPGEWSPVMPLDESETVNSAFNEGEASANLKGGNIYFTRCPRDKKLVMNCYIYTASKKGKGWSDAKIVDLGDSAYNYVHPYIMPDELTMYFASNMPGGFGGYDIYQATRTKKSGNFTNITNLGPNVNTAGQEVFPTMRGDSVLYFSSDGWPGMGSLDLFCSRLKNGKFQLAENLMYPLNSNGDDMSIIFDPTESIDPLSKSPYIEKGYFSSNRDGGRGGDDIYYFVLRPLVYTLAGYVRDDATLQYLDGVTVEIVGSDGTSYKTTTDVKGYYFFDKLKILGNTTYTIKVTKTKYWEEHNTATQTTVGLSENTDLKQDFLLTPIPVEPIILPEILYDLAKWDLKPQFKDSLLYLYNVMVKNPTLVIELRSHTDYRDNEANNEILSQKRAQSCVDFLVNEKGIAPARIVPKGYGEYRPRKFNNDFTYTYNGITVRFPKGTELTEQYILTLPKNQQDVANALNRRTEFTVLRTDYVPKGDPIGTVTRPTVALVQKRIWQVNVNGEEITGNCYANDKSANFKIESGSNEIYMSYTLATQFLKDMFVTVKDFELGEQAIKQEDGSIIEGSVLYLSDFRIDDEFTENVPVIIKKNLKYNFVIGENYIKDEWGDYTIDTAKLQLIFKK